MLPKFEGHPTAKRQPLVQVSRIILWDCGAVWQGLAGGLRTVRLVRVAPDRFLRINCDLFSGSDKSSADSSAAGSKWTPIPEPTA